MATNTSTIAPGLPGGADPAMVVTGPTIRPPGTMPATVPAAPPAPSAPSVPAVVTASPASADVNAKMGVIDNLAASQRTTTQQMATLVNPTTGDRKAVPVGSQLAQGLFGNGYVLETKAGPAATATAGTGAATSTGGATGTSTTPSGLTPLPEAPKAEDIQTETDKNIADFKANSDRITQQSDEAFKQYTDAVNQMRNGTFPLTPDQQAQIDAITQQYQNLIADQKVANRNYEGAVRQAGIAAGRNMYAPEVELGNANAAVSAGLRAISKIQTEMAMTITQAKIAFQDQNFKMLDSLYDKIQKHQEDQRKVISETYEKTKDALDAAQQKFENDMTTAQFEFQKVQELNKPILEADKQLKDYLYSEMQKYPDAGVTAQDTVASAVAKIKASASYKAEQDRKLAEIEQTKAQTAAAYASAAASRALAAQRAGGEGTTAAGLEGLSARAKAIYDDPSLLKSYTATEQGKILDEFANAGIRFDAAALEKVTATQRSYIAKFDDMERDARQAQELVGKVDTGPIAGTAGRAAQLIGTASKDFTNYRSTISRMNTTLLNLISGAAVTEGEAKRLAGFIPSITDDEKTAAWKISKFFDEVSSSKKNYIERSTQTTKQIMESANRDAYASQRAQLQPGEILVKDKDGNIGAIKESEMTKDYTKL